MFTIFSRIVHYGLENFRRSGLPSATTVAIMSLALTVSLGLMLFNIATGWAVASIQNKIDIAVYFKTSVPEDQILNIKQSLESLSEVKNVDYVSRDQALQIFKDTHADKPEILQAVDELNTNPLEASLNIKARKLDQYASIAEYLNAPNLNNFFDTVSYSKNQAVIDRLISIINNVNRGGFGLTVLLALIAGVVVFNTIRLAIYSNRDEISIMRAVGASNSLVRGPYVVEGVIAGALAAVMSLILALPVIYLVSPHLKSFIASPDIAAASSNFDILKYFYTALPRLFLYQLLLGVGIGVLSGFVAVRRYLKN